MKIRENELRNKILGCWFGKNVGGTLGAPFEWRRQINDVTFYTHNIDVYIKNVDNYIKYA